MYLTVSEREYKRLRERAARTTFEVLRLTREFRDLKRKYRMALRELEMLKGDKPNI